MEIYEQNIAEKMKKQNLITAKLTAGPDNRLGGDCRNWGMYSNVFITS